MQKPTSTNDVQLALIQEAPVILVSLVVVVAMTILLMLHIIAIADADPIYYLVLSYFLSSGTARLVAAKMQSVTASTGQGNTP